MSHREELVRAASLLAVAMSAGSVLSACQQQSSTPAAPTITQGGAATPSANTATNTAASVDELRQAASVLRDWQRRDPSSTAQVLTELGLFACDETTTACIAAKNAHTQGLAGVQPAQPQQQPAEPSNRPQGAVA